MRVSKIKYFVLILFLAGGAAALTQAQNADSTFLPAVPKTWDDEAMANLEVPLADPAHSPKHVSADYYYRIPVRPIYKSYPVFAPGKEPSGYQEWLRQQRPEEVMNLSKLKTEADWLKAGEMVFDHRNLKLMS